MQVLKLEKSLMWSVCTRSSTCLTVVGRWR